MMLEKILLVASIVKGGGVPETARFSELPDAIDNIHTVDSSDNGKVVVNGELVAQTAYPSTVTTNGTINTTTNNSVTVAVPTYSSADNGKVVNNNGELVSQTAHTEVTTNQTVDTTYNNSVVVNVPTYSSADAGKVVNSSGALVSQTAASNSTITTNGTYNYTTTYNNSKKVIVNVQGSLTQGTFVNNYTIRNTYAVLDSKLIFVQFTLNNGYSPVIRVDSSGYQTYVLFTLSNFKINKSTIKSIYGVFNLTYINNGGSISYDTSLTPQIGCPSSGSSVVAFIDNDEDGNLIFGIFKGYASYAGMFYYLNGKESTIVIELN